MEEGFTKYLTYLTSIGITEAFHGRITAIYEYFREICPKIEAVFINEYVELDGSRRYETLCFFSEKYFMDAKEFIEKDELSITPIKNRVYHYILRKQDYDYKKAREKSRLYVKVFLDIGVFIELKASGENCDYLRDIIHKYVVPNLKE